MKASKDNIRNVLGQHAKGLKMTKAPKENGYCLDGFLPRIALMDLFNQFHCYMNKKGQLVVITTGRLNVTGRIEK